MFFSSSYFQLATLQSTVAKMTTTLLQHYIMQKQHKQAYDKEYMYIYTTKKTRRIHEISRSQLARKKISKTYGDDE